MQVCAVFFRIECTDGRTATKQRGGKSLAGDVGKLFECPARREAREGAEIVSSVSGVRAGARRSLSLGARGRGASPSARARAAAVPRVVGARVPRRHQRGAPGGRPGVLRDAAPPGAWGRRARGGGARRRRGRGGRRQEGPRQLQPRAVRLHVTATQNRARPPSGILRVWEVSASSVPTIGAGGSPLTRGPVAAEELSSPPRDSERMARHRGGGTSQLPNCWCPRLEQH
nr:uncharacterized protein LOC116154501 [Camelus dromedarius]